MGAATATAGAAAATKKQQKLRPKNSIRKNRTKNKKKKPSNNKVKSNEKKSEIGKAAAAETPTQRGRNVVQRATASQQLSFFVNQYQSANRVQLSSLELDSLKEFIHVLINLDSSYTWLVVMGVMRNALQGPAQNMTGKLDENMKIVFGSSWKQVLFEKHLQKGHIDPGCPALLVISSSALRSLELLRELRSLTKECHAAKLFSKHMKIEEQVSILKNRVNIASGTPSRIKKLIDIEALGLSRLAVIVLDMHTDVKGYSLFTLPQVRDEFWDLYRSYFHQPLLEGKVRLCLYGPVPTDLEAKKSKANDD
ncbi:UNVERIFIED_CONTAM: protein CMSS1 [Sesamum radiatum]|uniref:Protein CMSS1 n=1 Tax=Sesamum radiatum TaxID=300843 RepID=A0AAW2SK99_SESRA